MIPSFTLSGTLPPFIGSSSADVAGVSPYKANMLELVSVLGTTKERVKLCTGLLDYRKAWRTAGLEAGVQWINGSFCENVEVTAKRAPGDIDLVTIFLRPDTLKDPAAWKDFVGNNPSLFDRATIRQKFGCDAFFVDLSGSRVDNVIRQLTYWFGLFTHQKATHLWKGILQIPLMSDDEAASQQLSTLEPPAL